MGRLRGLVLRIAPKLVILTALGLVTSPAAAWADCPGLGPYHLEVRLDNAGGPLTDYFALFTVDTAGPVGLGLMRADLQDLRAADVACNPLDFWVESGANTPVTRIWVKMSTVPTGSSQFDLYFGNLAATRDNQPSDVFGAGIASLYLFTENGGMTVTDWVGGHNLTVSAGLVWHSGPRAGVGGISGFGVARLLAADSGIPLGTGDFTVFSAVDPAVDTPNTEVIIGAYASDGASGWHVKREGAGRFYLLTNQSGISCTAGGLSVSVNQWSFVGGRRRTGVVNSVFHNGALVADGCEDTRDVTNPAATFELGRGYGGNYPFSGSVSLSMVYTTPLSDQEIAALYASLFPSVEPSVTVEEIIAVTSAATSAFTVTAPGAFTFTAAGITPDIDVSGTLPAGVTYNDATATISGAPVLGTVGSYPLTITATSGLGGQATQSFTLEVAKAPQNIAFPNPGPQQIGGRPARLLASATSALAVTFTSSTPDVCMVSGMALTLIAAGTCGIEANQAGDANYLPAPVVSQSFAVGLGSPGRPTGVAASVNGNLVMLSWSAPPGAAPDAYLVEVGDGPGRTTVTTLLTAQLTETGLLPHGEYFLRVRAQNEVGLSDPSDDVWVRVTASAPVAAPPIGFGASVTGTTVQLSWNDAAFGAPPESYLLQVGTDSFSADVGEFTIPAGTTAIIATNVPQGSYVARVRAITSAGRTPPTPALWFRVGSAAPCGSAPESPMVLTPVISDPIVGLSWLPPPGGSAKSFVVQAGSGPGLSDLIVVDVGAVAGLGATAGDGRYMIRALSTSDCGASAPSVEQTLTVGGPTPAAPTGLAATPGPGGVTFNWSPAAAGAAATHFVLEAGLTTGTTLIKVPVGSTPTFTVPGVPSGVTFVARVRGANASGIGTASAEIVVTVP